MLYVDGGELRWYAEPVAAFSFHVNTACIIIALLVFASLLMTGHWFNGFMASSSTLHKVVDLLQYSTALCCSYM